MILHWIKLDVLFYFIRAYIIYIYFFKSNYNPITNPIYKNKTMINDFLNYENIKIYLNYEQLLKNIVERTSCDEISNITSIYKTLTFQWLKLKTYRNILCIVNITYEVSWLKFPINICRIYSFISFVNSCIMYMLKF